jgi:hypothetical protein
MPRKTASAREENSHNPRNASGPLGASVGVAGAADRTEFDAFIALPV